MLRFPRLSTPTWAIICFTLSSAATAQDLLEDGPWALQVGPVGPLGVTYEGEPLLQMTSVVGYRPAWQGARFTMAGAEVTVADGRAEWSQSDEGNQTATLSAEIEDGALTLALDTRITAEGPTEFATRILPGAVRASEGHFFLWLDDRLDSWPTDRPFERTRPERSLTFERATRTVRIECEGFELQDRRDSGAGLYLVRVIAGGGAEPTETQARIRISVTKADPMDVASRALWCGQIAEETAPIAVANEGFEAAEGLSSWSRNPVATDDEETVHTGARSARIEIGPDDDDAGHIYITQQVRVSPRGLYQASAWAKAEGVEAATIGGRSSTGATLIVEFADREGKWLAPGDYAEGLYGTTDWSQVTTDRVRAPADAGYAIIFLALRARGTAWFDDVTLTEIHENVLLCEPLPAEMAQDNTPRFAWQYPHAEPAVLELTQNPDFAPQDLLVIEPIPASNVSLHEPIEPGKWFWRVRIPGHDVTSAKWAFTQTAPLTADTTEPLIEARHGWLETADTPVEALVRDTDEDLQIEARIDGVEVEDGVPLDDDRLTVLPPDGWTEGFHAITVRATDSAGNASEATVLATHTDPLPETTWLESGGIRRGDERLFLLGMYGVRIEDMPEIAAAGFDYVHNYTWDGAGANETALEYLDRAHELGMQAFIGFSRQRLMAGDERFVAERVGALMAHPGLFAWYLYDEPDLPHQHVPPASLERFYRLIKALDPFHPVVVTCAIDSAVPEYRNCMDVHWTQVYGDTNFVASRIERHREAMAGAAPIAAILHCYDRTQTDLMRGGGTADPAAFQPDARVLRANAFMAIAHNSSGLSWWWWGQGGNQFLTVGQAPEAWQGLQDVVAQINQLRPGLTAEGETEMWVEGGGEEPEVHVWEKRTQEGGWLIVVNRDDRPTDMALTPKLTTARGARALFEDRAVQLTEGRLSDHLDGLGVHVYELTK